MGKKGTQTGGSACTATYDHGAAILVSLHSAVCGPGHACDDTKGFMLRMVLQYDGQN